MMRTLLSILVLTGAACSSDPTTPNDAGTPDSATTDAATADVQRTSDSGTETADLDVLDVGSNSDVTSADVAPDATTTTDSGTDSGTDAADATPDDPFVGRPTGQCVEDTDCPVGPMGQMCSRALPGGACLGCGDDTHCPAGSSCSQFGACVTDCGGDDDCPPGLECLGSGRCAALNCSASTCPIDLFGCNASDRCERIDCSDDPTVCPDHTTCTGGRCIEDRALNP